MTKKQKEALRHALGLDRETKPFRNYYADEPGCKVCAELVALGAMVKGDEVPYAPGLIYYYVTTLGKKLAISKEECVWTEDKPHTYWSTGCGEILFLDGSGPEANGMTFCCFCGKRLIEK